MTYTHWKKERKSIPFKKKMNQAEIKIGSRVWYRERKRKRCEQEGSDSGGDKQAMEVKEDDDEQAVKYLE